MKLVEIGDDQDPLPIKCTKKKYTTPEQHKYACYILATTAAAKVIRTKEKLMTG